MTSFSLSIIKKNSRLLFSTEELKSHLRISRTDHDELITHYCRVAMDYVSSYTGKTLFSTTYALEHNNSLLLPYGPVKKINSVQYKNRKEKINYYTEREKDSLRITLPFHWKEPDFVIEYEAGYGDSPEDVPLSLRHSVLHCVEYLYRHNGRTAEMEKELSVWLKGQRTYTF